MTDFDFYDIVRVAYTEATRRLGVSGADGIILGKAEGTTITYAVLIGDRLPRPAGPATHRRLLPPSPSPAPQAQ